MNLNEIKKMLKLQIKEMNLQLSEVSEREKPEGVLCCRIQEGVPRYYIRKGNHEKYIRLGDEQTLRDYCQERFCRKLEQELPGQIKKLERVEQLLEKAKDEKDFYEELSEPIKKYAVPETSRQKEMIEGFYMDGRYADHNTYHKTDENRTEKGDIVRSKSELIIANMLYRRNIPYDYERVLYLKKGNKKYPDFTILNTNTGKLWIWEHFGRMDDPEYLNSNLEKINDYHKSGYIQGKNLIMTFETKEKPLSTVNVSNLIEQFLL